MSFQNRQESQDSGKPIRLYEFSIGTYGSEPVEGELGWEYPGQWGAEVWRYASSDRDIPVRNEEDPEGEDFIYTGGPISDKGIIISGQASADPFEVTMPASFAIAQKFRGSSPSQTIKLTVYDMHHTDDEEELQVVWVGEIAEVSFPMPDRAVFKCVTLAAAFSRTGLRLSWGRNCPHMLYDKQCGLLIHRFLIFANISSIVDGQTIEIDQELDPALYAGGMILWKADTEDYRDTIGIESITGYSIKVFGLTDRLAEITEIAVVRGCARTVDACLSFNPDDPDRPGETTNIMNFGGAPHLPGKSPFDGSPVF